jgi:apolipoprotein N-acyltransferase
VSSDSTTTAHPLPPADDPYADRPSFWRRNANALWAIGVFVCTVVLTVACFPPFHAPEFAYAFAAPAIFWAYLRPGFRLYAGTMFAAQAVAWTILLGWLHHVTIGGLLVLGPLVGAWVGVWYLAVWWVMPQLRGREPGIRVLAVFGLAALWVLVEWTRSWLFGGFPWLPLSVSQWQRPILLQIASYTGGYAISFILVFFNCGFAAYAHRLLREKEIGLRKRSPEFMAALLVLMFPSFLLLSEIFGQQRAEFARVALVQPYIPQQVKWDSSKGPGILEVLETLTVNSAVSQPDLILWPEAVTPWAVRGDDTARRFVEDLAQRAQTPLLLGSIAIEGHGTSAEAWYNGAFVVTPDFGLEPGYYAKRRLVPFGEFVPLRPVFGWLRKFVEIGDDFQAGEDAHPLVIRLASGPIVVGPLICYEDIYPQLARSSALAGAEVLTVMTNNGWFGEGGAAYQHAAHSALRAVETRRPVIRVGNGGWSGWFDEFGNVRTVLTNNEGSVYFRGTRSVVVSRDARWIGRNSYYTEHGDWFVALCAGFVLLGFAALRAGKPAVPQPVVPES